MGAGQQKGILGESELSPPAAVGGGAAGASRSSRGLFRPLVVVVGRALRTSAFSILAEEALPSFGSIDSIERLCSSLALPLPLPPLVLSPAALHA